MTEKVILQIQADSKDALRSIDKINRKLGMTDKQGKKANNTFSKMGKILGGLAIVGGLTAMARSTINVASNLEEAENKLNAVFGAKGQKQINDFANAYRDSVGASVLETKNFIADAGNLFTGFGMGADEANKFSKQVLLLTNDLASFNNLSTGDAQRKMMSALMGESDSAKGLGASILETQLKVASLAGGFGEYSNKMDENTKIMIRFKAIQMQSKNAVGDMEKSAGSYVDVMRKMSTAIERISIMLGKAFLPAISAVVGAIGSFINMLAENADGIMAVLVVISSSAVAYGAYTLWVNRATLSTKLFAGASSMLTAVLNMNPVLRIISLIGLLSGALYYVSQKTEELTTSWSIMWLNMRISTASFVDWFAGKMNQIIKAKATVSQFFRGVKVGSEKLDLIDRVNVNALKNELLTAQKKLVSLSNKGKIPKNISNANGVSSLPSVPSIGGGASKSDGESYFESFDKGGSNTTKNGALTIGNVTINITKNDDDTDDKLLDKLTYKLANEFAKAGKLAGII